MPNQRKATFINSSIPKRAINAGRKAVIGILRIGAATGLMKSYSQGKLAIINPSGRATMADHRNAWKIRHQLWKTLPSRSCSVQRRTMAWTTPVGLGKEKGGKTSQ